MSLLLPTNLLQCRSSSLLLLSQTPSTTAFSAIAPRRICLRLVTSCVAYDQSSVVNGSAPKAVVVERDQIRLGLVSEGRMATNSLNLLKLPNTKVCFQRPKDIVTKLLSGDLDLGIVGLDKLHEYGQLGPKFMKENGIKHVTFSTASGALEAAPAMGIADVVLDLVSSGTTLKENNLKEIEGGVVLQCKAVLVASRRALTKRKEALNTVQEILERIEAHLKADSQFTVVANFRGSSAEEVAERVLSQPSLSGWQGPTISPVYCRRGGKILVDYYAIVICVPKKTLYDSVKHLRAVGGSGVLVSPLTYIFDEDTPRWGQFLRNLGI